MIIPRYVWFLSATFFLSKVFVHGEAFTFSLKETGKCECGKANAVSARIAGGRVAQPNEYPWMVAIFFRGNMYCGGSLINDRYILTAGHCLRWVKKEDLSVILGMHDRIQVETRKKGAVIMDIEKIMVHEKFKSFKTHDIEDIGLIKLKHSLKYTEKIRPVCLPKDKGETYADKIVQVIGWGKISQKAGPSRYLREANVKVITNEDCRKAPLMGNLILDSMMCAYQHQVDACQGDSGGPMTFETKTGKVEQIGVVSWGIGCAKEGMPGVYVRLTHYLDWIALNTDDAIYCKNP